MTSIGLVVEGAGDADAFPTLVAKISALCQNQFYAGKIVKGGSWPKLKRHGELERFCKLAASHSQVTSVVVTIDLDDGCAKSEAEELSQRIQAISNTLGKPVSLVFCVREYETWFLENIEDIKSRSPEISWKTDWVPNITTRGAKEVFAMGLGSKYRETVDQSKFTKRLNINSLYFTSRSFRKFVKELTGLSYADCEAHLTD